MEIPLVWQMHTSIYSHMNLILAGTPYNVDKYEQIKSLLLFSFAQTKKKYNHTDNVFKFIHAMD